MDTYTALEARIRAARSFDPARFLIFDVNGASVGYVRRDLVKHLRRFADILVVAESTVAFRQEVDSPAERSAAMASIARALEAQGLLSSWRDETYDIGTADDGTGLFKMERAAVRFFGFDAQAVHVNGLVAEGGSMSMWIARRSADKAIDPGMLDNMVGGGLASGLSVRETLAKEAWEEAGIPAELAATARHAGSLRIRREVPEGLHSEIIHVHDLFLPADFVPANQDGEVAELRLSPLGDVLCEISGGADYTVDAALVAIDCLVRHGRLDGHWASAIHAPLASSPRSTL
jgi:8-oxo-dGTP pyrophosphatase MutT (NUDIX family)